MIITYNLTLSFSKIMSTYNYEVGIVLNSNSKKKYNKILTEAWDSAWSLLNASLSNHEMCFLHRFTYTLFWV